MLVLYSSSLGKGSCLEGWRGTDLRLQCPARVIEGIHVDEHWFGRSDSSAFAGEDELAWNQL